MEEFILQFRNMEKNLAFLLPPAEFHHRESPWPAILADAIVYAHENIRKKDDKPLDRKVVLGKITRGTPRIVNRESFSIALKHLPFLNKETRPVFLGHIRDFMMRNKHILPVDEIKIMP